MEILCIPMESCSSTPGELWLNGCGKSHLDSLSGLKVLQMILYMLVTEAAIIFMKIICR